MIAVAGVATALTVLCLLAPKRRRSELVRIMAAQPASEVTSRKRRPWWLALVPLGLAIAMIGTSARLAVALAVLVAVAGVSLTRLRRRRLWARERSQVCDGCQVLAGQLQAGQLPVKALAMAANSSPVLATAAATSAIGGDVAQALATTARRPGCGGLATVAAAWELAHRSGAPVAALIARVAEQQREEVRLHGVVAGELAAPRATGGLLSLLPAVGVAMAAMVGADPVHFLTQSALGSWCVLSAVVLSATGLLWTDRLARSEFDR